MSLYALGLNHATAPLDVREQVAFAPDSLGPALRDLLGRPKIKEAAILSTCNRTELYVHSPEPQPVVQWLEEFHRVPKDSLAPYIYTLPREKAVTHAFRVASGLDSMVLGEPQILGQMKQAVRHAESAGTLGLVLNRLFQRTFAVAKDVRSQTDIGSASISMAAASVKLAERIFPSIGEQRLLFIGAGEMIDLTATHFAARKPRKMTIANRTIERGRELAQRFSAEAITLNEMPDRLPEFDIIVTCTASTLPILGKGLLERVVKARRHAPVFIVDLAVPRDVEPEASDLDDVFLYSVGSKAAASCRRSPRSTATTTSCARPSSSARGGCFSTARRPSRCWKRSRGGSPTSSCTRRRRRSTTPATRSAPSWSPSSSASTACPTSGISCARVVPAHFGN